MRLDLIGQGFSTIGAGLKGAQTHAATVPPLLVEAAPEPVLARGLLMVSGLGVLLLLGWASFAPLDEVARAPGMLVAHGNNATIQHMEGGLLQTIEVHEGDTVSAGQPLFELDPTGTNADLATLHERVAYLEKQHRKLMLALGLRNAAPLPAAAIASASIVLSATLAAAPLMTILMPPNVDSLDNIEPAAGALADDPQLAVLAERWRMMRDSVQVAKEELDRQQALRTQGFGTSSRVYGADHDYRTQMQALAGLESEMADQLAQTDSELEQQHEQEKKLQDKLERLVVRAPVAGVAQGIRFTTVGAAIAPGATLMEVVPGNAVLEAVLKLPPANIGSVHEGQKVAVKLTAYESARFGFLEGTVTKIAADTMADEAGRPVYQVWVSIPQQLKGAQGLHALRPGMVVVASIITGHRSVLDYLLKPLRKTLDDAWKET